MAPKPAARSSERVEDSDLEADESDRQLTPKSSQHHGQKRKSASPTRSQPTKKPKKSAAENSKTSQSSASTFSKPNQSAAAPEENVASPQDQPNGDLSLSDSESQRSSRSNTPSANARTEKTAIASQQQRTPSQPQHSQSAPTTHSSTLRAPSAFVPPDDYKAVVSSPISSSAISLLSDSNISSKQLWHISAPSSLPISKLVNLSLDLLDTRTPCLSYNGSDYIIETSRGHSKDRGNVLVPKDSEHAYRLVGHKIERTLIIQHCPVQRSHPAPNSDKSIPPEPVDPQYPALKLPPKQPTGLRVRYAPPGFELRRHDKHSSNVTNGVPSKRVHKSNSPEAYQDSGSRTSTNTQLQESGTGGSDSASDDSDNSDSSETSTDND